MSKKVRGIIGLHGAVLLMFLRLANETEEHTPDYNDKTVVVTECIAGKTACAKYPPVVLTGISLDI